MPRRKVPKPRPFALVHPTSGGLRLSAVDRLAESEGLAVGMTAADAKARAPRLRTAEHDKAAEPEALQKLAWWCGRFSPWTAPARGASGRDGVFLDITGCDHLFGGETKLLRTLIDRLGTLGFTAQAGLADTPGAAWALARHRAAPGGHAVAPPGRHAEAILDVPVAGLRLEEGIVEGLASLGFKTIGSLIDLPREPLTARFGTDVAHRLDQALGVDEEPISPETPLVPYRSRAVLAEPIVVIDHVKTAIGEVAGALCRRMIEEGVGARRLEVTLFRVDGEVTSLAAGTAAPTVQADHIVRLFADQLERARGEFDAGFGFDAVALAAPVVEAVSPGQRMIAAAVLDTGSTAGRSSRRKAPQTERERLSPELARLVDGLGNRLGAAKVYRFAPGGSHVPEEAVRVVPFSGAPPTPVGVPPAERWDGGEGRPVSLLLAPEPIEVMAEIPDGPPRRFRWRRAFFDVARYEGPERIADPWWRGRRPDAALSRDYYRVEDAEGRRFWVCRHGLYGRETDNPVWYMHGVFA